MDRTVGGDAVTIARVGCHAPVPDRGIPPFWVIQHLNNSFLFNWQHWLLLRAGSGGGRLVIETRDGALNDDGVAHEQAPSS